MLSQKAVLNILVTANTQKAQEALERSMAQLRAAVPLEKPARRRSLRSAFKGIVGGW